MVSKLERAELLARKSHDGQFRRDGRTPYIDHPEQIVAILKNWGIKDEDILSAAWLHDTVEDTKLTCEDIESQIGSIVAGYVWSLTKMKRLDKDYQKSEDEYIAKIANGPREIKLIKLADVIANLLDMHNIPNLDYKFDKYLGKKITYIRAITENWH